MCTCFPKAVMVLLPQFGLDSLPRDVAWPRDLRCGFFWAVAGEARDDVGVGADLALSFIAWCGLLRVVPGS